MPPTPLHHSANPFLEQLVGSPRHAEDAPVGLHVDLVGASSGPPTAFPPRLSTSTLRVQHHSDIVKNKRGVFFGDI